MKEVIIKLAEAGWNISNGAKGTVVWLYQDEVSQTQLNDANVILGGKELSKCSFTHTVSVSLDFPANDVKGLLLANKLLPKNYSELEMASKYIKS